MIRPSLSGLSRLALAAALLACNGSDTGDGSESGATSDSGTDGTDGTTSASTTGSTMSGTQSSTTSGASDSATTSTTSPVSDSQTTDATTVVSDSVTISGTETDPTSPTDPTDSDSDSTTQGTTDGTTTDGTTTDGTTDGTTTDGTTDGTTTDGTTTDDTTTGGCVPAVEVCNDVDDDCNGFIDDVDEAQDGICDCLNIVIMGKKGANPSSEFETWLEAQGTKVDRIHTTPNEALDKDTLGAYDIVILDWLQRNYTQAEADTLEAFIAGGGGMMSMTGFTNNQANADVTNSLIKSIGLTYNTSKGWFSGPITTFAPHPITMGLTSISFFGGLYINIGNDGIGVNQTIMTLPQGPVGVVQERKEGRAFVFGDEWVEFDSQWQNIPQIKLFWVQTLKWIGPQNSCILPM